MMRQAAIALALTLLPSPAIAQSVAASFAPPLDHEIRYQVVETRHRQQIALGFTLDQRVRFAHEGRGYRMTVAMHAAKTDAPAAIAERFDAAFRPFVGLEIALLLSADGKPLGLIDEAATWNRLLAAIDTLRKDATLKPAVADSIEGVFTSIAALPPEARQAKLMENPLRLVGYALPAMAPGASVESGDAREGASATLEAIDPASLTYAIRTRRPLPAAAILTGEGKLIVDRTTGLLVSATTREWVGVAGAPRVGDPDASIVVTLVK